MYHRALVTSFGCPLVRCISLSYTTQSLEDRRQPTGESLVHMQMWGMDADFTLPAWTESVIHRGWQTRVIKPSHAFSYDAERWLGSRNQGRPVQIPDVVWEENASSNETVLMQIIRREPRHLFVHFSVFFHDSRCPVLVSKVFFPVHMQMQ